MPDATLLPELRPATLEDAGMVADLESLRDPAEPRDPILLRHWWLMGDEQEETMRLVAVRDGAAVALSGRLTSAGRLTRGGLASSGRCSIPTCGARRSITSW